MAARFIISAARPEQFPPEAEPEVAFLGRSNVGKSTLLNALVGGELAFTSSRPGCTQWINFYQVDGGYRFVDLPGYGFSKVPQHKSREWKELIERYLTDRQALRLAVLMVDARRGWMRTDVELREWLEAHDRPYVVVVTKVDKLKSQRERHQSQTAMRAHLPGSGAKPQAGSRADDQAGKLLECSAVTGRGVREIWQVISKTLNK